jgi:hypothetical protein
MANLDMTTSPSMLSSETNSSDSSSESTPSQCTAELSVLAVSLVELSKILDSEDCFSGRAEAVLEKLSAVHHNFYALHNAIFDMVNWPRRNALYMQRKQAVSSKMTEDQLDSVLSKLGL